MLPGDPFRGSPGLFLHRSGSLQPLCPDHRNAPGCGAWRGCTPPLKRAGWSRVSFAGRTMAGAVRCWLAAAMLSAVSTAGLAVPPLPQVPQFATRLPEPPPGRTADSANPADEAQYAIATRRDRIGRI